MRAAAVTRLSGSIPLHTVDTFCSSAHQLKVESLWLKAEKRKNRTPGVLRKQMRFRDIKYRQIKIVNLQNITNMLLHLFCAKTSFKGLMAQIAIFLRYVGVFCPPRHSCRKRLNSNYLYRGA